MWFSGLLFAMASVSQAGEVVLYAGNDCPNGCGSSRKLVLASDRSTGCIPVLGNLPRLSAQSLTNIAPKCNIEFFADARCTVPEFFIDTAQRVGCRSFTGPGSFRWSCSGGPLHNKRGEPVNSTVTLPLGPLLLPPLADDQGLGKRQCNHEGLHNNMLFFGAPVRDSTGAVEGGTDIMAREVDLGGGGGFPGGTINADARDVTRETWRRAIPSRSDELEFTITTGSGLRFEISLVSLSDYTVSGAITEIGAAALAAILAASFVAMNETGNQLLFFRLVLRNLNGSTEDMLRVSIELLDNGNN
jgi:hypothetical protein